MFRATLGYLPSFQLNGLYERKILIYVDMNIYWHITEYESNNFAAFQNGKETIIII